MADRTMIDRGAALRRCADGVDDIRLRRRCQAPASAATREEIEEHLGFTQFEVTPSDTQAGGHPDLNIDHGICDQRRPFLRIGRRNPPADIEAARGRTRRPVSSAILT